MELVLLILAPSILLRAVAMDVLLPCIPSISQYYDAAFTTSQWVLSSFFLGAGVGQLVLGPLTDEYGRRRVLLWSTLLLILSSLASAKASSIHQLIVFRLVQGVAAAGTTAVTMAIVRDLYDDKNMPKVSSYLNSIIGLAPLFAPLIGGALLTYTNGWQANFYFVAVFSLVALVVNYSLVHETNPKISDKKPFVAIDVFLAYKNILTDKQFLSYTFCAVMGFSCLFMFFSTSAILMIDNIGMTPTIFGYYFALNSVVYIIGNMLSPWLQNKVGPDATILHGSIIIIMGASCMLFAELLQGLTVLGLMLPNVISTFGVGLIFGPCMGGVMKHYKHIAGTASAVYGAILYGFSGLLVAAIMQFKVTDAKLLAITMGIMGFASLAVVRRLIRN